MSGHTPGPWAVVEATEHHGFYVVSDFGSTIADLYTMTRPDLPSTANGGQSKPVPFMHEMDEPNARLIAAAPMLLDAVDDAVKAFRLLRTGMAGDAKAVQMIDAHIDELEYAIAKATGQ